jgi:hypothetical protein
VTHATFTYLVDDAYSLSSLERILADELGPLTDVAVVIFAHRALLLRSASGSSLWISAGSVHLPLQASILTNDGVMTITFGRWNQMTPPKTPNPEFSDRVALLAAGLAEPLRGDIDAIDVGAAADLSEFQSC